MASVILPSFESCGSSYVSSDLRCNLGPLSCSQVKGETLGGRGFCYKNISSFACKLYFKQSKFRLSVGYHGSIVSVTRCELGHTMKEPLVGEEPIDGKTGSVNSSSFLTEDGGASDVSANLYQDNVDGGDPGFFGGSGGNGEFPRGGGGGGSEDDNNDGQSENGERDAEFGPVLKFEEVMKETEARGVNLPPDMYEAAKTTGIQKVFLDDYLDLQGLGWPLGAAIKWCPLLRDRMLADRQFLFKIGTEIVIDSCCATFAEVQKRGKDFWAEFELYAADLLVGVVVNVVLVGLLAPYARIGQPSTSKGLFSNMARVWGALPSSVFEAERPGCKFSIQQRIGTYFYKGVLYGAVGFVCGLVGQGIANMIMTAKRLMRESEEDIPVPPLLKSAALWGAFLAVSSNARYQIINGLERMVESSPVARRAPPLAMTFTVGVRFANNVYGGMQFVDWARWSGCQ